MQFAKQCGIEEYSDDNLITTPTWQKYTKNKEKIEEKITKSLEDVALEEET